MIWSGMLFLRIWNSTRDFVESAIDTIKNGKVVKHVHCINHANLVKYRLVGEFHSMGQKHKSVSLKGEKIYVRNSWI